MRHEEHPRRRHGVAFMTGMLGLALLFLSSPLRADSWRETWDVLHNLLRDPRVPKELPSQGSEESPRGAVPAAPASAQVERVRSAFPKGLIYWEGERPHRILLPGEQRLAVKSLRSLAEASEQVVAADRALFGVSPEDLSLEVQRTSPNLTYLIYGQHHEGLPVEGGRLDFRWTHEGQLVMVGHHLLPIGQLDTRPGLAVEEALPMATGAVGLDSEAALREDMELVVVPDGELGQLGDRLAWRIRLRAPEGEIGWWRVWVDAHRGEVLKVRDLIYDAVPAEGTVVISAEPLAPDDPQEVYPASNAKIVLQRPSGDPISVTFTDADGRFQFGEQEETDLVYLTLLEGRNFKVFDHSGGGDITPVLEIPVEGSGDDSLRWSDQNSGIAARDVYVHANIAHDTVTRWDPQWVPAWQLPMPAVVEYPANCNAYFDGQSIVFYSSGGGCASTARIADVVYHEYAHGITYTLYQPFDATSAMHEAYSDYYGATLTNQSKVGVGFFGPGTHLRDVDNTRRWPNDIHGDPHETGLILAGAFWDLREAVGAEVADYLYHFHRYGLPMTFKEAFLETLILDDDDGNIFNGTPHFDAITSAFLSHGIGDPSVQIQHEPLPDTEQAGVEVDLTASIFSLFGLEPDSLLLFYRGAPQLDFDQVALEPNPQGGTRSFRATIQGQPEGTVVEYYLFAADTSGHRAWLPSGAPDTLFTFFVGKDTIPPVLVPDPLPHATADQDSFLIEVTATDNTGRLGSVAVHTRRPSDGGIASSQLESMGDDLYRGYVQPGPLTVGDEVLYRVVATDAAAEPNTTVWPDLDGWGSFDIREGWYTDLESAPGDFAATGDWQWGIPVESKGRAHSGENVWATSLDLVYSNLTISNLTTALDLTGMERATFEFWHSYETESDWDGGRLMVSTDGGNSFRKLLPSNGYPHGNVAALQGEGYSGSSHGWRKVEVPLDLHLGKVIELQFLFASDESVVRQGWMLDDLRLVGRQSLSVPIAISAESGVVDGIPLSWSQPRGVDPSLNQFLGYNVYRGNRSGEYGDQPINAQPLRSTSLFDRDVVPGVTYHYVVTALYDEGESERSREASGTSFQAVLALDMDTLSVTLDLESAMDTTLSVANAGFGDLSYETFLADPGQELDDVRLLYERGGGSLEQLSLLQSDPQDASGSPDISALLAGDDGEKLTLRIREHAPHGDPREDFTVVFGLDTDLNQETGLPSTNLGADYLVLLGALPVELTSGQLMAFILKGDELNSIVGFPTDLDLVEGRDSISVQFTLSTVGDPNRFSVQAVSMDSTFALIDALPDTLKASWLSRDRRRGTATSERPSLINLSLDATGLASGIYEGRLLLETNDLNRPRAAVGVLLTVGSGLTSLASLEFNSGIEGLELAWMPPVGSGTSAFRLYRRQVDEGEEVQLRRRPGGDRDLLPDAQGIYHFLDRGVRTGETYAYRFEGVLPDGRTLHLGTETHAFDPGAPAVFSVLSPRPNPFRSSVTLRFGIPREGDLLIAVYDVRGRRVTTLRNGPAQPGIFEAVWTGQDSKGNRVASGVYFALVQWERIKQIRRMVLTR